MPPIFALLVLLATLATQLQATLPSAVWVWLAGGLALVGGALAMLRKGAWAACLLLAVLLGTWAVANLRAHARLNDALPSDAIQRDIEIVGRVVDLPRQRADSLRIDWVTESAEGAAQVPRHLLLTAWQSRDGAALPHIRAGERWRLTVRLKPAHGGHNFYGFDYEAWLFARGVRATGTIRSAARIGDSAYPDARLAALREDIRTRMLRHLGEHPQAGVLVALAIGDGSAVSQQQWQRFRDTGVIHLMSISGLHVTMLAAMAAWLAGRLWTAAPTLLPGLPRRRAQALAAAFTAAVYVPLAGFGVPAQRTLFMVIAVAWMAWRGERWWGVSTLGVALVAVCLLDPWAVMHTGFWLSFGAVALLMWCCSGRLRQPAWWMLAVRTQWAASIGLLPATLWVFQQFSLMSPVANAFAIPAVSLVITPLALLGTLPGFSWVLPLAAYAMGLLDQLLQALLQVPDSMLRVPAPSLPAVALAAVGALYILLPAAWPRRYWGALAMLPVLAGRPLPLPEGAVRLTTLDVGQGLALVLETRQHTLVYDTGPAFGDSDAAERVVVPQLQAMGRWRVDDLVISHDDLDHRGGADSLLRRWQVGRVWQPAAGEVLPAAGQRRHECLAGRFWQVDGVRFEWLHPPPIADTWRERLDLRRNESNCVLRVVAAGGSLLLPGDLEKRGETLLLDDGRSDLAADLLVSPHHGSRGASSTAFVRAVAPSMVVHSTAFRGRFGHPHPQTLERYRLAGAEQWRTDCDGAVRFSLSPQGRWTVETSRGQRPRYWQAKSECASGIMAP